MDGIKKARILQLFLESSIKLTKLTFVRVCGQKLMQSNLRMYQRVIARTKRKMNESEHLL